MDDAELGIPTAFWPLYMYFYMKAMEYYGPHMLLVSMALDCFPIDPDDDVGDCGSGPGFLIKQLIERGHRGKIRGFDAAPVAVAAARERFAHCENVEIIEADLEAMPWQNLRLARIVYCINVLYALRDQQAFITKLGMALAPGGAVVLTTITNPDADLLINEFYRWRKEDASEEEKRALERVDPEVEMLLAANRYIAARAKTEGRARSPEELRTMFEAAGFKVERIEPGVYAGTATLVVAVKK